MCLSPCPQQQSPKQMRAVGMGAVDALERGGTSSDPRQETPVTAAVVRVLATCTDDNCKLVFSGRYASTNFACGGIGHGGAQIVLSGSRVDTRDAGGPERIHIAHNCCSQAV